MSDETPGQQRIGRVADPRHRALLGTLLADALARERLERNAVGFTPIWTGVSSMLRMGELARIKLATARDSGDLLRGAYAASTQSWPILTDPWAVNDRPMPPAGAVWAHLPDLAIVPPDLDRRLRRLFVGETAGRIEAAIALIDRIVSLLDGRATEGVADGSGAG